jgi:hypothetical protein
MQNPQEWDDQNPFAPSIQDLSEVPCEPTNCPFSAAQIDILDRELEAVVDDSSRSMDVHKLVWQEAFTVEFLIWNKLIWNTQPNSVVWNGPWVSPKWPFTTVEYISYGISAVWNGVGQHIGWSPNFIPYEGFNCRICNSFYQ